MDVEAEAAFFDWCRSKGDSGVHPFDQRLWPATAEYRQVSWYNASLTTTVCKFLQAKLYAISWSHEPMLEKTGEAFASSKLR